MLVDAHAHIFPKVSGRISSGPTEGLGYGRVAIGGERIQLMPPLCEQTIHTAEMLIAHMDWAGVDKAVLLQGPFYGECNQSICEAVRSYPDRFFGFAYLDPWDLESHAAFERVSHSKEFVGVKVEFSEATGLCGIHPGVRLDDPNLDWLWAESEQHGLVVVIDLGAVGSASYQTHALGVIATRHSALTIVIAHLAQPTPAAFADELTRALWREQISLGLLPNVYFDTASLPAYVAEEGYPFPTAGQYLWDAIRQIGPDKVMWGTDVPSLLSIATYKQLVQLPCAHLSGLPQSALAQVMGENALRVFRRRGRKLLLPKDDV